jgi:molybdate transport repressor ModE-like protein
MLDLRQFHVLRAIARNGSIAAAARNLHYGQPTISHHLSALESHLGTRLVDRGPRGTELTDIGRLLLEHVDPVLDRIEAAEADIRGRLQYGVTTLRVGTFATAGARLLPPALRQILPGSGVRVELVEAEPLDLLALVRAGTVHCALIYDLGGASRRPAADLVAVHLADDPYRLILPPSHRLAGQSVVDLRDLREEGWIFSRSPHDPGDRMLVDACEALGYRPRVVLHSDDYRLIYGFVAADSGIALIPQMAMDPREPVIVRPTVQDLGARSIDFVTQRGQRAPMVRALGRALVDAARPPASQADPQGD